MKKTSPTPTELQAEALAFRQQFSTLLLSTCSADLTPEISYAPYVCDEQHAYFIFVSELAAHTRNLQHNPQAGILLIEDEPQTRNLFARKRLSLNTNAEEIDRNTVSANKVLDRMEQELGKTIGLLRTLPDFHLFKLSFKSGSYIRGFGEAFELSAADLSVAARRTG